MNTMYILGTWYLILQKEKFYRNFNRKNFKQIFSMKKISKPQNSQNFIYKNILLTYYKAQYLEALIKEKHKKN